MFYFTIFFTLFISNIYIILQIFFLFLSMISKYKIYIINDKNKITSIYNYIKYSTFLDDQQSPHGFILGNNFIGFLNNNNNNSLESSKKVLYIWTNEVIFKDIFSNNVIEGNINYWYRDGNYWDIKYKKRLLHINIIPNNKQQEIMNEISLYYNEFNKGVFFIYGEPGKGKSSLLRIVGNYYKSHICKTLKMSDPNDTLEYIYNSVVPTKETPLIILFDEIDTLIRMVHHNQIQIHKHYPIEVYNKTTYNTFFDNINDNMFPYLILLLTSNKSKEEIDNETHSCYLREGRVNKYFYL